MDFLQLLKAAAIGVVEGLTEFLPISSTGHILLFEKLIGFESGSDKAFEIVIQLGAILAVCWLYRAKLWAVARGLPTDGEAGRDARRFARGVLVAFFPAALVGAFFHTQIKAQFFNPHSIALALILGGVAILLIERRKRAPRFARVEDLPLIVVAAIGCIQSFALIPGVSRSGATIMGALLLGADRKTAAEFSFFLAIPTMLGATVFSLYRSWHLLGQGNLTLIAVGFFAAFCSALLVVRWLVEFISRRDFSVFGWYRIGLGMLILLCMM